MGEEVYAPAISDFVYITDNAYTESEIRNMELKIIRALNFDLCQPVSLNFLRRYSKAGDVDVLQHSLAKYVLETSLLDVDLAPVPGSLLASASLCLSLALLESSVSVNAVWSPSLQYYSGYSKESVLPMVSKLASNILKLNNRSCTLHARASCRAKQVQEWEVYKGSRSWGIKERKNSEAIKIKVI